jgi:hypothetical protein
MKNSSNCAKTLLNSYQKQGAIVNSTQYLNDNDCLNCHIGSLQRYSFAAVYSAQNPNGCLNALHLFLPFFYDSNLLKFESKDYVKNDSQTASPIFNPVRCVKSNM